MPPDLRTFEQRVAYSDALTQAFEQRMTTLARRVARGEMTIGSWQITMREEQRLQYKLQLAVGAGGSPSQVDSDDWLRLGPMLKSQYEYLENFGRDLQSGKTFNLEGRARMYARASREVFWEQALPVKFPAVPGDGTTKCLTNCRCQWINIRYEYNEKGRVVAVLATWQVNSAETCPTCVQRSIEWATLRIPVKRGFKPDPLFKAMVKHLEAA